MEQEAELKKLGEDVRKQGYGTGAAAKMKDLVFDPETGTFKASTTVTRLRRPATSSPR